MARYNTSAMVQGSTAKVASLPAPVGGWNARDSLANMDPRDAVILKNMFPAVSNVVLRGGYTNWATGLDGQVQTLMAYSGGATNKLFAVTSTGKIYNVTSSGAVGAAVVTGLTNGYWEYTNISTTGGNYLYACNGVDKPQLYDGTNWTAIDGVSVPAITGVTTTTLSNVILFKNRLWFIQKDTLTAWYLPTGAIGGVAQQTNLQSVARMGGKLVDLDAWTIDAGYGVDDNLAFMTNKGELILYSGTDPANAATWSLIGVWKLGEPVGTRCMLKWTGDLLVLTLGGLIPMASTLQSSRLDPRVALTDKIQGAITQATTNYGSSSGWQVFFNAKNNCLHINVPVSVGSQEQYAMNTITGGWAQFTGWPANCWENFNNEPYFGANGVVCHAWDTNYADNTSNIAGVALQAFNYFESMGVKKYFTRARPSIYSNGTPGISVGMNIDFDTSNTTAPIASSPASAGVWGTSVWDTGLWGAGLTMTNSWLGITGIGFCGGLQLQSASQGLQIEWASTDVVYQTGFAGV